jgi:hypothetical protein
MCGSFSCTDIFVHDRQTGVTTRVSVNSAGDQANGAIGDRPAVSGDGRSVAFFAHPITTNLVAGDTNNASDVFVHQFSDLDGDGEWDPFDVCPANPNCDGDGFTDGVEVPCGSDPLLAASVPERLDTPGDDDGDGLVNEALPSGSEAYDCDGDGFSGAVEQYVFSAANTANDQKRCGVDAWPADINNSGFSDISDIVLLTGNFGAAVLPAPARYDLAPEPPAVPGSRFIDISDIVRLTNVFGLGCS